MDITNVLKSFGLTLIVGLTMGIGSFISFFVKETNKRFLALSLSFSAGIMVYVSFMGILPEAISQLEGDLGHEKAYIWGLTGFFGGMILIAIIERAIHRIGDPHGGHDHGLHDHGVHSHLEHEDQDPMGHHHMESTDEEHHLSKLGLVSAIAIAIHNLPEGLAIFTAGLNDITLAIPIAVAVIMHNIPLGMAISIPIFYSTKSRKKAMVYTILVGLCQPLGAILGYLVLSTFFSEKLFGVLFAIIAGIMIFVAVDELLPTSQKYEDHHISVYGFIVGMIVMAISLSMFGHGH